MGGIGSAGHDGSAWRDAREAELRALVQTAITDCPQGVNGQSVTIETTLDEIVDVRSETAGSPVASCTSEAIWSIRLPPSFDRMASFRIELSP